MRKRVSSYPRRKKSGDKPITDQNLYYRPFFNILYDSGRVIPEQMRDMIIKTMPLLPADFDPYEITGEERVGQYLRELVRWCREKGIAKHYCKTSRIRGRLVPDWVKRHRAEFGSPLGVWELTDWGRERHERVIKLEEKIGFNPINNVDKILLVHQHELVKLVQDSLSHEIKGMMLQCLFETAYKLIDKINTMSLKESLRYYIPEWFEV